MIPIEILVFLCMRSNFNSYFVHRFKSSYGYESSRTVDNPELNTWPSLSIVRYLQGHANTPENLCACSKASENLQAYSNAFGNARTHRNAFGNARTCSRTIRIGLNTLENIKLAETLAEKHELGYEYMSYIHVHSNTLGNTRPRINASDELALIFLTFFYQLLAFRCTL